MTTHVYIYSDVYAARMIYVGMTQDLKRRHAEHVRNSPWMGRATHSWAAEMSSIEAAQDAERMLIGAYAPAANIQHRVTREAKPPTRSFVQNMNWRDLEELEFVQMSFVNSLQDATKGFDVVSDAVRKHGTIGRAVAAGALTSDQYADTLRMVSSVGEVA